jgi:CubicO group peptidase (beta-lactamase class C family)
MPIVRQRLYSCTLLAVALVSPLFSQSLPMAAHPEDVGFSTPRLERLRAKIKADAESGRIPGAVLLVARRGKIASLDAIGLQERSSKKPMTKDSIFRIASMSKPITSVAIMILAEEGKIDLAAPVAQYLPEFRDVKVGPDKVAPKRPMTVQDLLRHTSGLTYGLFGTSPVDAMYRSSPIFTAKSLQEMVQTIASLPLLHQPGEFWEYSVGCDVLGRLVEVVSGKPFDEFVAERITRPLKMPDTAFYLTAAQATRLAHPDATMAMPDGDATVKPPAPSGGGGMLSTASDYARFCQMLLNRGELDGVRILSPSTVAMMTSDQLPPGTERHTPVAVGSGPFGPTPEMGTSFGLGFAVKTDPGRNPLPGGAGIFAWSGITGTHFWVDPQEKVVAVMMIQLPQSMIGFYGRQFRTLVYQALME